MMTLNAIANPNRPQYPYPYPGLAVTPPCPPPPTTVPGALAAFAPTSSWRSNLFTNAELRGAGAGTGQAVAPDTWTTLASGLGLLGTGMGAYHGYRRTGSVGWTVAWALLGGLFPIITIPVAFAQGFGKPSAGFPRSGASRARAR